jgi:hypothetical protein
VAAIQAEEYNLSIFTHFAEVQRLADEILIPVLQQAGKR